MLSEMNLQLEAWTRGRLTEMRQVAATEAQLASLRTDPASGPTPGAPAVSPTGRTAPVSGSLTTSTTAAPPPSASTPAPSGSRRAATI